MSRLKLHAVDHPPAAPRVGGEGVRDGVAGNGHAVHCRPSYERLFVGCILHDMDRRIYYQWDGVSLRLIRAEGITTSPNTSVTVRQPDADQVPWGVWVNGERSPNTYVIVNGQVLTVAHPSGVPILCHSISADAPIWDQHEARGGGTPVRAFL